MESIPNKNIHPITIIKIGLHHLPYSSSRSASLFANNISQRQKPTKKVVFIPMGGNTDISLLNASLCE